MNKQQIPIIIGVGEVVEHLAADLMKSSSVQSLAAQAALEALKDAGEIKELADNLDVVVAVRTLVDSSPMWPMPFGKSNNMPRSIAQRIGANPATAVYSKVGGDSPQRLVNHWAEKLVDGDASMVLLAGAEAMATTKAAIKQELSLDWSEEVDGDLMDEGLGLEGLMTFHGVQHQLAPAPVGYALCENSRRAKLGCTVKQYQEKIGKTLAPFSRIASDNPYSMFSNEYSQDQISHEGEDNSYVAYPYTRAMVAKDGVNQAAAVLMTTVGKAKELGIDQSKWVYLHGYADAREKPILERQNLGQSLALRKAYQRALSDARISGNDLEFIDVYSCFPIVILEAQEALDLPDSTVLTQTGGLPFFGGPGNNYSMHGICAVVRNLRTQPDSYGLVGANGGYMDKHSVGVYSCRPGWCRSDCVEVQAELDEQASVKLNESPVGKATIESYTVQYSRGKPLFAIVVGLLDKTGERFIANNFEQDQELMGRLVSQDMVGQSIEVVSIGKGNRVALSKSDLEAFLPPVSYELRNDYQFVKTDIRGHILEIIINRPDSFNALHPMANEELAHVFDCYEKDESLWVAILTGAGDKAFCTGNDLKYSASGKPVWLPKSGFGGITSRRRKKVVIAAVNGFAMGGGMEIALACDIIIASENAQFGLPEVKVGLIAGAGGIQRLTRQIPLKKAMDMLITGKQISSSEALKLGFINQVVSEADVLKAAREYAEIVCENSPTSVRLTLELLAETSVHASVEDATEKMPKVIDKLFVSEDFVEGPRAFAEKRKPKWSGR